MCRFYYKIRQLLKNATFITNYDSTNSGIFVQYPVNDFFQKNSPNFVDSNLFIKHPRNTLQMKFFVWTMYSSSQNKNTNIRSAKKCILKVNNRNIRKTCEVRSELKIKRTERSQ